MATGFSLAAWIAAAAVAGPAFAGTPAQKSPDPSAGQVSAEIRSVSDCAALDHWMADTLAALVRATPQPDGPRALARDGETISAAMGLQRRAAEINALLATDVTAHANGVLGKQAMLGILLDSYAKTGARLDAALSAAKASDTVDRFAATLRRSRAECETRVAAKLGPQQMARRRGPDAG